MNPVNLLLLNNLLQLSNPEQEMFLQIQELLILFHMVNPSFWIIITNCRIAWEQETKGNLFFNDILSVDSGLALNVKGNSNY